MRDHIFVLAIYPSTRGFAFVLFEGALSPVDWGVKEMRGGGKNARSLAAIGAIVERYRPGVLVLQDTTAYGTLRARRIRKLNAAIGEMAEEFAIPTIAFSRTEVMTAFSHVRPRNKHELAAAIAKHIPAFERYLPPPRKPWMSEDVRMNLFDAVALALTFFQSETGGDPPG
jgi:hypothetical protein